MNTRILLRTAAVFLLIVMMIPLLSACADNTVEKVKVENVFKSEYITIPDEFQPSGSMNLVDGRIYMQGYENKNYQNIIYAVNTDGSDGKFIELLPPNDGSSGRNSYVNNTKISSNGNILFIYNEYFYNEETYESTDTTYFTIKNIEGNIIQNLNLTEMFKTDSDSYFYIHNMYVDKNNNIYFPSDRKIFVIDESGNHLFTLEMEENTYINNIIATKNGDAILVYNDYSNEEYKLKAKTIDINQKKLGSEYDISNLPSQFLYTMIPSDDEKFDFFYNDNISVYGINLSTGVSTEIINWINSDIDTSYTNSFCVVSSDELICAGYDYLNSKSQVMMLERVPEDQIVEKYILTLAAFSLDSTIKAHVIDFNRNNLEYRIQVEDYYKYSTDEDYYAGITKLNTDISTGKIPDILFIYSYNMDVTNYNAKGVFADFNKFIEDDPEINRSDYFENVLDAAQYNGKLYQLFTGFYIRTVVGKSKFFENMDGWTIDEFNSFMASQPEGTMSFQNLTQTEMLNRYCTMMIDDFIDKNTGRCNFDSEGFIKVLDFCKTLNSKSNWEDPNFDYEQHWLDFQYAYKEDRVLLMDYYLDGFNYFWDTMRVEFGEDISFIGMPTESKQGSSMYIMNEFSMSAKTKHPDGVWSFLRQFIMDDFIENSYYTFTIKRSSVEKKAEEAINPPEDEYTGGYYGRAMPVPVAEVYVDEVEVEIESEVEVEVDLNGDGIVDDIIDDIIDDKVVEEPAIAEAPAIAVEEPVPEKRENIRYIDDQPVDIGFITREYTDMIINLIENTHKILRYDNEMIEIIMEEAGAFFEGQKTSAETAKVIQNRLQNYIDEKR